MVGGPLKLVQGMQGRGSELGLTWNMHLREQDNEQGIPSSQVGAVS
jgi:hypothetical protein